LVSNHPADKIPVTFCRNPPPRLQISPSPTKSHHFPLGFIPSGGQQQGAPVNGRIMKIRPQAPAWKQLKVEVGLGTICMN